MHKEVKTKNQKHFKIRKTNRRERQRIDVTVDAIVEVSRHIDIQLVFTVILLDAKACTENTLAQWQAYAAYMYDSIFCANGNGLLSYK